MWVSKMTTPKIKLKEGHWYNDNAQAFVNICKGNKLSYYNMFALDYPDIVKPSFEMEWEVGDFGPAREEVKEASGL